MGYKGRIVTISVVFLFAIIQVTVLNESLDRQILELVISFILAVFFGFQYDRMRFFAEKDFLTEIYSRRYGFKVFPKIKNKMKKKNHSFAVFVIDVNNFKLLNDSFGHDVGDTILKK